MLPTCFPLHLEKKGQIYVVNLRSFKDYYRCVSQTSKTSFFYNTLTVIIFVINVREILLDCIRYCTLYFLLYTECNFSLNDKSSLSTVYVLHCSIVFGGVKRKVQRSDKHLYSEL